MKNFLIICCAFTVLLFTSCENEFTVNADWEDITVVYGLLDPQEDTNWIRVQRAYLGSEPASASFDNPDSLYYENIYVSLVEFENVNGSIGNQVGDTIRLTVDYTSRKLEEGTFTTDGYRLYRTQRSINPDNIYKLVVKKPDSKHPDASSTTLIVGGANEGFAFIKPNQFVKEFNGGMEWYASNNAKIYEIDVYLRYKEVNRSTGDVQHLVQKIDYGLIEGSLAEAEGGDEIKFNELPDYLYQKMASSFPPLPPNSLRFMKDMRIEVWAGGEDLAKYIGLNKPTLGVNQSKPEFPDIENGVGLFSSRTKIKMSQVNFTQEMNDSYYLTHTLCDLGFAIVTTGDTCYCDLNGEQTCF